jgi:hypothetical protein
MLGIDLHRNRRLSYGLDTEDFAIGIFLGGAPAAIAFVHSP